jgi:hypothetical protein
LQVRELSRTSGNASLMLESNDADLRVPTSVTACERPLRRVLTAKRLVVSRTSSVENLGKTYSLAGMMRTLIVGPLQSSCLRRYGAFFSNLNYRLLPSVFAEFIGYSR